MPHPDQVRSRTSGQGVAGGDGAGAFGGLPAISELDAQRYDVQAGAELADTYDQVLKHGESFAVFDRHGDILPEGMGEEGIYHRGTRHVSGLVLRLAGRRPLLLGSTAKRDNSRLAFDLTNTDLGRGPHRLPHSSVHLSRTKVLWDGVCHERLVARSFARQPVRLVLTLRFRADFADLFEVRGMHRAHRGRDLPTLVGERAVVLRYVGLDGVIRRTRITFSVAPSRLERGEADFELDLPDQRAITIDLAIACESGRARPATAPGLRHGLGAVSREPDPLDASGGPGIQLERPVQRLAGAECGRVRDAQLAHAAGPLSLRRRPGSARSSGATGS